MTPPYKDLPASQLVTVQDGIQLEVVTAAAWIAFKKAAKAEANITITIAAPLGGYRSHAQDVDFHENPAKYNKNPNIGLLPIDYSEHRTGKCVDVVPWPAWVKDNAHRFGFSFPIASDVNHMLHDGTTTASESDTPITLTRKTPTMYLKYDTNGAGYLFTDNGSTVLTAQEWELFKRLIRANVEGDFANPASDPFLAGEMAIISKAIQRTNPAPATVTTSGPVDLSPILDAIAKLPKSGTITLA